MKLTKKIIDTLPLPSSGQKFIWDDEIKGFGLRLTSAKKTYIVQGRVKGKNQERRVSLGEHGVLTIQEASRRAKKELSAMLEGTDPVVEQKRVEVEAVTLQKVVEKYLLDRRDLKPNSRNDINKHLNKSFATWAEKPFISITRDKVLTRFRELSDRSPAQANQAFRVLRALLNYAGAAYRHGDAPILIENPVKILSDAKLWHRVQARSGRIPTDKIGAAWNALQQYRQAPDISRVGETLSDAISFLMLTGSRWSEMAELTWDRVNLEDGSWNIPDPKNRTPITFPLPMAVVEILKKRPLKKGYIFPARSGDGHIRDARGILDKISTAARVRISPHDLRRTFRAVAGEVKVEFWKTKLLMGHKMSDDITVTHYTETSDLRYLLPDINLIANWIVRQGAIAATRNVIQLPIKSSGGQK